MKRMKKICSIALLALATLPVSGQDLLARQAPIDRKMKAVDSVALHRLLYMEELESPAADLYDEWENVFAHRETAMPDSFRIDLRDFCMPTPSRVITSNFGPRWGRQHKGLDVKVYIGDTIRAAFSGKVRIVRYEARGYGKYVVIRHHNGLETIYGHMSAQLVKEDQEVRAGDPIGLGGNTGRSTGSHLHFETRLCGVALNPALMFDFRNQDVTADFYTYKKSTYSSESAQATLLRGVAGGSSSSSYSSASAASKYSATRLHKVRKGETLSSIARKHGTSVAQLQRINHLGGRAKLRPGQILKYN